MIGSVSASENISLDNSFDEILDSNEISEVNEGDSLDVLGEVNDDESADEPDDTLGQIDDETIGKDNGDSQDVLSASGTQKLNIDAKVNSKYVLLDEDEYFYINIPKSTAKDFSVYIDGKLTDIKIDPDTDEESLFTLNFVKAGYSVGKHTMKFSFAGNSKYAPASKTYTFNLVPFSAFIPKTNWGDEYYILVSLSDYEGGTVSVIVDNKVKAKYKTESLQDEDGIYMPDGISYGTHDVEVKYQGKLGTYSVKGKYVKSYVAMSAEEGLQFQWGDVDIYFFGDNKFTKPFTVKIGGNSFKVKLKNGEATLKIPKSLLKIGKNTISLSYSGDKKFPGYSKKAAITMVPKIVAPYKVAYKGTDSLIIHYPSGTKAKYTFYKVKETGDGDVLTKIKSGSVTSRIVYIPKMSLGKHLLYFKYTTSDGFTYGEYINLFVEKNSKGFKSSVSKKTVKFGKEIKVKIKSPKLKTKAFIYVDGKKVKRLSLKKGTASAKVQMLSQGKHRIKVYVNLGGKFYSKAYFVTVKKPTSLLTLKTVKVKKSAKKLVLKATLKKPNKKAISVKKVTFKFKGKTYNAKTNKNGVAKVTIKKSVLKKLKVGKKVNYQVAYQYTLKKSAIVKK